MTAQLELDVAVCPAAPITAPLASQRCAVGDRMRVRCRIYPRATSRHAGRYGEWGWWTVTVESVTRLGCGCDRAETTRPLSGDGLLPGLHLHPTAGHDHGTWITSIDFDAARAAVSAPTTDTAQEGTP